MKYKTRKKRGDMKAEGGILEKRQEIRERQEDRAKDKTEGGNDQCIPYACTK